MGPMTVPSICAMRGTACASVRRVPPTKNAWLAISRIDIPKIAVKKYAMPMSPRT